MVVQDVRTSEGSALHTNFYPAPETNNYEMQQVPVQNAVRDFLGTQTQILGEVERAHPPPASQPEIIVPAQEHRYPENYNMASIAPEFTPTPIGVEYTQIQQTQQQITNQDLQNTLHIGHKTALQTKMQFSANKARQLDTQTLEDFGLNT